MNKLDAYVEARDELSKSIERVEELLEVLESLEKHPQQMIKDDVILYFGNLAKMIRLQLKTLDKILDVSSDLDKRITLNKKLINLLIDVQPNDVKKGAMQLMKEGGLSD
jgi:hypothetical protein